MSLSDDLKKGRELYRRKHTHSTNGFRKKKSANPIVVGFGTIIEQLSPLWKKAASMMGHIKSQTQPYKDVVHGDFKCLLDRIAGMFPKKPVKYDPLYEAWKRSRNQ